MPPGVMPDLALRMGKVYRTAGHSNLRVTVQGNLMAAWKLTLSYDGTAFHGWQIQPGLPTVQGFLGRAIRDVTGETVLPQGSGRTDAGVHALGQVASFSLDCAIPAANLHRALNRALPPSIRILSVEGVTPPFHARHSALRKTYEYRIFPLAIRSRGEDRDEDAGGTMRICSPMLAPYAWDLPLTLDLSALNRAASHVLGRHDFTSFAATGAELAETVPADPLPGYPTTPPTPCRVIYDSCWSISGDLLMYRVTGSGFLHHMVRNLVGTFVQAGAGRSSPDNIPAILAARRRSTAGPTAPARGLFLVRVEYP